MRGIRPITSGHAAPGLFWPAPRQRASMPSRPASPPATTGQRGWKRQPDGMLVGSGGSPVSTTCSRCSISGTTESRARVYGSARVMWFDALTLNVDRSWRNPNLLRWHGEPWLIDHGAALYFHHDWSARGSAAAKPYPTAADHVLLPVAAPLTVAHDELSPRITPDLLETVLARVPDEWLDDEPSLGPADAVRSAYAEVLLARARDPRPWLDAVEVTRAAAV
jgi:hypothetical protein